MSRSVCRDPRGALLTLAGGVAVADGIRRDRPARCRSSGRTTSSSAIARRRAGRRKLGGILAEASTSAEGLQHVVLGFGINCGRRRIRRIAGP